MDECPGSKKKGIAILVVIITIAVCALLLVAKCIDGQLAKGDPLILQTYYDNCDTEYDRWNELKTLGKEIQILQKNDKEDYQQELCEFYDKWDTMSRLDSYLNAELSGILFEEEELESY